MNVRYRVELDQSEREQLTALLSGGKHAARKLKRAQILLAADSGVSDEAIATSLAIAGSTIYRTKRRFVEGNLEAALSEEPRPGAARKLTGKEEALLVATACSKPPEGRARWTLELLAGAMVKLTEHEDLSRETVRRRLAENHLKPWRKDMWCIAQVDGSYVAHMEDVLDLYAEAPDPKRPVVCFDESPTQLVGEVRQPIPAGPGQLERYDCEYKRNGTANLFVFFDIHRGWRRVKVTEHRTARDFAQCMRELVDAHYPEADQVRVVLDNLFEHIHAAHSTKPSRRPKLTASSRKSNSTTPPSTPAGSTWLRSRSACCAASAWIGASQIVTVSSPRSLLGSVNAMPSAPGSTGCSRPSVLAPNWPVPIQRLSKIYNLCAAVLGCG